MKKTKVDYWSNVSKKPKGFTFVKPMTYTYEVPVIYVDNAFKNYDFDKIFIKVKMKYDNESNRIEFDMDVTKIMVIKEMGTAKFQYGDGLFKRDNILFPFITHLRIFGEVNKKEYLDYKLLKSRRNKLNKIRNKIN